MKLRIKISLLIAACVLLAVAFTTLVQARFFASDQESYLSDFQSTLAIFSERQLDNRMNLLYAQLEPLIPGVAGGSLRLGDLVARVPGAIAGSLWRAGKVLDASGDRRARKVAPVAGASRWALARSPFDPEIASLRWIGRYGDRQLALDLKAEWFNGILESTHGALSRLTASDGLVLIRSGGPAGAIHGEEFFENRELARQALGDQAGVPQTRTYAGADGSSWLGTFLPIGTDPKLMIAVTAPGSEVQAVIRRVYRQTSWVAGIFLILSIAAGIGFAASLTSPLQALVEQTIEVAKGRFEGILAVPQRRRDEVGILSRSFGRMMQELLKIRDELRRTERLAALGKFSSAIAHEIKNPLSSILGNTQVAKRKLSAISASSTDAANPKLAKDISAANQALEFVEEETLRANQIVSRLMKFARQDKPPETVIDVAERVRRSAGIVRPLIDQAGATIEERITPDPVLCVANGDQLHEVLLNLIQNALHAMRDSERKTLTLSLSVSADRQAVLRIADTGHGIPAEAREHLFEPFFTTKGIGEGTGLGLAVCHGIVQSHRGSIEVESEPGRGTAFVISLPLAQPAAFAKSA